MVKFKPKIKKEKLKLMDLSWIIPAGLMILICGGVAVCLIIKAIIS